MEMFRGLGGVFLTQHGKKMKYERKPKVLIVKRVCMTQHQDKNSDENSTSTPTDQVVFLCVYYGAGVEGGLVYSRCGLV